MKKTSFARIGGLTMLLFMVLLQSVYAGDSLSIFQHLSQGEELRVLTIETNLKTLIRGKYKEEYQLAWVAYTDEQGKSVRIKTKIRARGNMRKQICFYPPFKIKFPKKALKSMNLNPTFNDVKVVSRCKSGDNYEDYVLREYLAYQLYNEMTDKSFRVKLLRIKYVDTGAKKSKNIASESYGFLIEPEEEVAARLNAKVTKPKVINSKYVEADQFNLIALFQLMIGNTDWAIANSHNIRSFRSPDYPLPFCIPYDYDYSGFVNTSYATPSEGLPIETVRERHFRGKCRSEGTYEEVAQLFLAKKSTLLNLIQTFDYLSENDRKDLQQYLESFFEIIESERYLKSMLADCLD